MAEGQDATIIACGIMVTEAIAAAKTLAERGLKVGVINLHTIKPIDQAALIKAAQSGAIVTAEEHSVIGGLGGAVAELITTKLNHPVPIEMVGVKDCFGQSGNACQLQRKYGLTEDDIVEAVLRVLKRKKS